MRTEFILDEYQINIIYKLLLQDKYKIRIGEFEELIQKRRGERRNDELAEPSITDGSSPRYILDQITNHFRWGKFRDNNSFTLDRDDVRTILSMLEEKEDKNEDEKTLFNVLFLSFKF